MEQLHCPPSGVLALSRGRVVMLATVNRSHEHASLLTPKAQRRYPGRTLHLIDVENLAGTGRRDPIRVSEIWSWYRQWVGVGALDQIVVACNHLALVDTALGWPDARYRVRSGPDGADLELLDVLCRENVVERFARFVIASGDGVFAAAAASLAAAGRWVTVVSRREALSARLKLAACAVIYADATESALPSAYGPP